VNESHDSNENQIDGEQKHSEIFGDVHESFLRQVRRVCTLKIDHEWTRIDTNSVQGGRFAHGTHEIHERFS
jgi:hypothetical protein